MIRLAVRVRREQAELVLAELLELAPAGVEEHERDGGTVEYAIYGAPGELPALPDLRAAAGGALVEVSTSEIADDWHERWRAFHGAVTIAAPPGGDTPGVRVRPPWEPPAAGPAGAVIDVVIDPGQAFGTGAHATTRLCLELLLELARLQPAARPPLIDVGAGSGVLAIVATRLGFAPVLALDNDPLSVRAVSENAQANNAVVEVRRWDLRRQPLPTVAGAVVLANLLRPLLLELADALPAAPPQLIASGLLREEADEVAAALLRAHGMRERARRERGAWAALWLEAPYCGISVAARTSER